MNALVGGGGGGVSISPALPAPKRVAFKKRQRDAYEESDDEDFYEDEYNLSSLSDDDDDEDEDHGSSSDDDYGVKRWRRTFPSKPAAQPAAQSTLFNTYVSNLQKTAASLFDTQIPRDHRVRFEDSDVDDHMDGSSMAHIYSKMGRSHKGRQGQAQHQQLVQREPITAEQYIMGFIGHLIRTAPPEDPVFSDPSTVTTEDLEQMFNDMSPVEMQLLLSRMVKNADKQVVDELRRELQTVISERQHGVMIVEE